MIKRYVVSGHSMEPSFYDGDKLLLSSLYLSLKPKDVVVFNDGKRNFLKRIKKIYGNNVVVRGDNRDHSSEWHINRNQIKGKLLMRY